MLHKFLVLSLAPLGLIAFAGTSAQASSSADDFCPYDLANDDTPRDVIDQLCLEWERSKPPSTRRGTYTGGAPVNRRPTPPPPPRCNPPACRWQPL